MGGKIDEQLRQEASSILVFWGDRWQDVSACLGYLCLEEAGQFFLGMPRKTVLVLLGKCFGIKMLEHME